MKYGLTDLTFNKDTANYFLYVSDDLLTVQRQKKEQRYKPHPLRFTREHQVLSNDCVSHGRHQWELEAEGLWDIAVTYKEITTVSAISSRSSRLFGDNLVSWSVAHVGDGKVFAYHAGVREKIDAFLTSSWSYNRIVVVVDFQMGLITFSEVDGRWRHLHTFKVDLDRPVCLGVGLFSLALPSSVSVKEIDFF
ncbi:tripartite motif-containing protein 14-like [Engraulis encrasicolus]|uniref:tripartite motif-containing protein 14-like n=1 Tax=Engraulis encrasicolus TaxID=184585 RepID=UPI002FD65C58